MIRFSRNDLERPLKDKEVGRILRACTKFNTQFMRFYLPTAVVIDEPTSVTPRVGRLYRTCLYEYWGKLHTSESLSEQYTDSYRLRGTKEVFMAEYWSCRGCDGHTDYQMMGYFLTDKVQELKSLKFEEIRRTIYTSRAEDGFWQSDIRNPWPLYLSESDKSTE